MRENFEQIPEYVFPISLHGQHAKLPVFRSDLTGRMVAYDQEVKRVYAIHDESRLLREHAPQVDPASVTEAART